MLTNEALEVEDAKEIKSHSFAELPTNLMPFITRLSITLKGPVVMSMNGNELPDVFDPIKEINRDCELILHHYNVEITREVLAAWRIEKDNVFLR
ncbi:MAG: hypothetical protein ACU841_11245 [Gammaproteobacteria bacterium]